MNEKIKSQKQAVAKRGTTNLCTVSHTYSFELKTKSSISLENNSTDFMVCSTSDSAAPPKTSPQRKKTIAEKFALPNS